MDYAFAGMRLGKKALIGFIHDNFAMVRRPPMESVAQSIAPPTAQRQSNAQESAGKVNIPTNQIANEPTGLTSQIVGNKEDVPDALSLMGGKEERPVELYPADGGRRYVRTLSVILEVTEPSPSEYDADVPQSKVDDTPQRNAAQPIVAPPVAKAKTSKPADVQDDTLTASRDSQGKAADKPSIPLDQVNAILTPQEEMAMHLLPDDEDDDEDIWLNLIRPVKIVKSSKQHKVKLPRPSYPLRTFDTVHDTRFRSSAGSTHPFAIKNGKVNSQSVAQALGMPPFVQPVRVRPAEIAGPLVHKAESFSPVVSTTHDISAKLLKPAGLVTAGLAGVGALVGVVWVFDKVKGFLSHKRTKKESSKKRRHVRDWSVE
jgi:hypothetical protein